MSVERGGILADAVRGAKAGAAGALFFSLVAAAIAIVTGEAAIRQRYGFGLATLIGFYFATCVPVGALAGIGYVRLRSDDQARWLGFGMAATLIAAATALVMPREHWFPWGIGAVVAAGWYIGSHWGEKLWEMISDERTRHGGARGERNVQ